MKRFLILVPLVLTLSCLHPMYFTKEVPLDAGKKSAAGIAGGLQAVIDDFDSESMKDSLGGEWQLETDEGNGGNSTGTISYAAGRNGRALRLDYTLGEAFQYRYCISRLNYEGRGVMDFSAATGVKFWIRGNGKKFRFNACMDGDLGYNWHGLTIDSTPGEWQEIVIPWSSLKQGEGWGVSTGFDPKRIIKFEFRSDSAASGESGWFAVDDFRFTGVGGGAAGSSAPVSPVAIQGDDFLLGDFEQSFYDTLGNLWSDEDDSGNGGNSFAQLTNAGDGANGSRDSLHLRYLLGNAYQYRYAILKCDMARPLDVSGYKGISFWIRGKGFGVKFHLVCPEVQDFDYHTYLVPSTTTEWKQVVIPFADLKQEGWGQKKNLDLKHITKIEFQTASQALNEDGYFDVDSIVLFVTAP
jgi:hypothetical protein